MSRLLIRRGQPAHWLRLCAAVAVVFAVSALLVGCRGGGGKNNATKTAESAVATRSVTPAVTVVRNAEGTVIATVVGSSSESTGIPNGDQTVAPGSTATSGNQPGSTPGTNASPRPGETPGSLVTPSPAPTLPAGQIATVTIDADPATPGIDHTALTVPAGGQFQIAIVVNNPPASYQGYEFGIHWTEGVLSFLSDEPLKPADIGLCAQTSPLNFTTGLYGGCLRTTGETTFQGPVHTLTFKCERSDQTRLRLLSLAEARGEGAALLHFGGEEFAAEVDEGIQVTCG